MNQLHLFTHLLTIGPRKTRIRDAAIDCFAEHGIAETTARKVAIAAGVSPGLVIHHYGSMEGLREACDTFVAASIRRQKEAAMTAGSALDPMAAIRESHIGSLGAYLARVLVDDSPAVAKLVDDMVADAEEYMEHGVEAGTLQPSSNPRGRAVVTSMWSLGALVLHRHMNRLMGVDMTNLDQSSDPELAAYLSSFYEIMGNGILTESVAESLKKTVAETSTPAHEQVSDPPTNPSQSASST